MVSSNSDEVFNGLITRINKALDTSAVLKATASTLLAVQKERVFEKGETALESKIGNYSTKPFSISKNSQVRKTGKSYYKGGYKEYKGAVGLDNSKVNLFATGQLSDDYSVIEISNNEIGLGFKNDLNNKKAEGNEKRFKAEIFKTSDPEKEIIRNTIEFEVARLLKVK